jgi:hypothetical protein
MENVNSMTNKRQSFGLCAVTAHWLTFNDSSELQTYNFHCSKKVVSELVVTKILSPTEPRTLQANTAITNGKTAASLNSNWLRAMKMQQHCPTSDRPDFHNPTTSIGLHVA